MIKTGNEIKIDLNSVVEDQLELAKEIICLICYSIHISPLKCKVCENIFCPDCIDKWLTKNKNCPVCKLVFIPNKVEKIYKLLLNKIQIKCQVCQATYNILDFISHTFSCSNSNKANQDFNFLEIQNSSLISMDTVMKENKKLQIELAEMRHRFSNLENEYNILSKQINKDKIYNENIIYNDDLKISSNFDFACLDKKFAHKKINIDFFSSGTENLYLENLSKIPHLPKTEMVNIDLSCVPENFGFYQNCYNDHYPEIYENIMSKQDKVIPNTISDVGIICYLSPFLNSLINLTHFSINLTRLKLTEECSEKLLIFIGNMNNLVSLKLNVGDRFCKFGDNFAIILSRVLKNLFYLKQLHLYLYDKYITNEGIIKLSESLPKDLDDLLFDIAGATNKISDDGLINFLKSISEMNKLEILQIDFSILRFSDFIFDLAVSSFLKLNVLKKLNFYFYGLLNGNISKHLYKNMLHSLVLHNTLLFITISNENNRDENKMEIEEELYAIQTTKQFNLISI